MTISFNSNTISLDSFASRLHIEAHTDSSVLDDKILAQLSHPTLIAPDAEATLYTIPPTLSEAMLEEATLKDPPVGVSIESKEATLEKASKALLDKANQAKIEAYKSLGSTIFKTVAIALGILLSGGTLAIPVAAVSALILIASLVNVIIAHINLERAEQEKSPISVKEFLYTMVNKILEKLKLPESIRKEVTIELFDQATDAALNYANKAQNAAINALPGAAVLNVVLNQGVTMLLDAMLPDQKIENEANTNSDLEAKPLADGN